MSTQINTYVMWGVILPFIRDIPEELYDRLGDSAFEKFTRKPDNGLTILDDGMDGKYTAIGHVIARTENHGFFQSPLTIEEPGVSELIAIRHAIEAETGWKVNQEPTLLVISHYR